MKEEKDKKIKEVDGHVLVKPKSDFMKEGWGYKLFYISLILIMIAIMFISAFPYINMVAVAFNEGVDSNKGGIGFWPRKPTLANMQLLLFEEKSTLGAAWLSVWTTVVFTFLTLIVEYSAAYAMKQKNLPAKKIILLIIMIPNFIGGGLIPALLLHKFLGTYNTIFMFIIPGFGFFNMIIFRQFLKGIPDSLEEAARIDGANEIQILIRIMLPLSLPAIATLGLFHAVGKWSDWGTNLYFAPAKHLHTLQFVLWRYLNAASSAKEIALVTGKDTTATVTPVAVTAAITVITSLPIIMIYPFIQRYFIKGVLVGGVKE